MKLHSLFLAFIPGMLTLIPFPALSDTSSPERILSHADSISLPTAKTDWIDPIRTTPVNTRYILYPTPERDPSTFGSCLVYLPSEYHSRPERNYPVLYYLHGGTGNQREANWLIERVEKEVSEGRIEPLIIVSPQALPIGWYINANESDPKVSSGPIHDMLINDLIPYIDTHFRTVADPSGRGIEGFSMGGRGALMMAFRHPDLFGAVSSVAGAVVDWDEEPLQRSLECTFGDVADPISRVYFESWHPRTFACQNEREIRRRGMRVRMFVGDQDRLFEERGRCITGRFHNLLDTLGIEHILKIVPGAGHNPLEIFDPAVNEYEVAFWQEALKGQDMELPSDGSVPEEIGSVVSGYFPSARIVRLTEIPDERGTHYSILLEDGSYLKFNEHFNWILADGSAAQGGTLPASLVHPEIAAELATGYPGLGVVRIEKVPRTGYDLLLTDGTTLLFDTEGHLIQRS